MWIPDFGAALRDGFLNISNQVGRCLGQSSPHSPTTINLLTKKTLGFIFNYKSGFLWKGRGTQEIDHSRHKHLLVQEETVLKNKMQPTRRNSLQSISPRVRLFTSQNKTSKVYWSTCRTHDSYLHDPMLRYSCCLLNPPRTKLKRDWEDQKDIKSQGTWLKILKRRTATWKGFPFQSVHSTRVEKNVIAGIS